MAIKQPNLSMTAEDYEEADESSHAVILASSASQTSKDMSASLAVSIWSWELHKHSLQATSSFANTLTGGAEGYDEH